MTMNICQYRQFYCLISMFIMHYRCGLHRKCYQRKHYHDLVSQIQWLWYEFDFHWKFSSKHHFINHYLSRLEEEICQPEHLCSYSTSSWCCFVTHCTLIVPCAIWISLISDILIYCAALATSSMRLRVYKTCNRPIRSFVISKISFTSSYNTVLTLDYM